MRGREFDYRKFEYKNIHHLSKLAGHSYYVVLPVDFIRELGWRERQKLVIKKKGSKIIIEDWKK